MSTPLIPIDIPDDYGTQAMFTAVYPSKGNNFPYCGLGLAGEVGELSSEVVAVFDNSFELHEGSFIGEAGDVLWYIAACTFEVGLIFEGIVTDARRMTPHSLPEIDLELSLRTYAKLCLHAGRVAEHAKKSVRDDSGLITPERRAMIRPELVMTVAYWATLLFVCGIHTDKAASHNLIKLRERQAKGTLHGEGSNR